MMCEHFEPKESYCNLDTFSGWHYADSNNEYQIIDGSRCYIACPDNSYIRIESFQGEYDDIDSECFQKYDNGIYVLIGLWNTIGPNATLPKDEDELEDLRIAGIEFLWRENHDFNNDFMKYPLKITAGIGRAYKDLPPSKYNRWVNGNCIDPQRLLSEIYHDLSECFKRKLMGDTKYGKCKTCRCHFLGFPGDCRNKDFLTGLTELHHELQVEIDDELYEEDKSVDSEYRIHGIELWPYRAPDWFLDEGVEQFRELFASPIPIECSKCSSKMSYGERCENCGYDFGEESASEEK